MPKSRRDPRFNKLMTALGRLCGIWASLERLVDQTIWELANVERKAGACLTAQMIGPGPRGKALVGLVELRGGEEDLLVAFKEFARDFGSLGAKRNRYVHDPYGYDVNLKEFRRVHLTADKKLNFALQTVTPEELDELYESIVKVMTLLTSFTIGWLTSFLMAS